MEGTCLLLKLNLSSISFQWRVIKVSVIGKRTELLIRAFLCPVCPFRQQELLQARGIVARGQCCVLIMCLPVSMRFISAVLAVWAGWQDRPFTQGVTEKVSWSPRRWERLQPSPVCSALLSSSYLIQTSAATDHTRTKTKIRELYCFLSKSRMCCSTYDSPGDVTVSVQWVILNYLFFFLNYTLFV